MNLYKTADIFSVLFCTWCCIFIWFPSCSITIPLLLSGSTDGKIHCWNTETGAKVVVLNGDHTGPVQHIQFNPKYMMLASACSNMVWTLPSHTLSLLL